MLNTKVLVFERERESHGSEKKEEKQRQIMDLEMLCCVGRKTKTNNGSGNVPPWKCCVVLVLF